jgi:FAD/FMN-containing dehydrogenase
MVDLSRMNRIVKIDSRNRIAVIEPGVTYGQLQPALAKEGLAVVPPLYPRANKSVVASLLERQPTLIPRYNYSLTEPLRNCGVVWGNEQKFSTGESGNSVPDIEAQWDAGRRLLEPKGPAQTDFFRLLTGAQGTLGIVTWASVRVEIIPDPKKTVFVSAPKLDDLVDLSYRLTRLRLGDELLIVNATYLAALVAADAAEAVTLRDTLPAWTLVIGIGGRALRAGQRVAVVEQDIAAEVAARGLRLQTAVSGVATSRIEAVLTGVAEDPHWKLRAKGAVADIFFHTTLDKAPGYLATMLGAAVAVKYPVEDVADGRGRLLLPSLRRVGRAGLQPRRRGQGRAPRGQEDPRPQQHPQPQQALLLGRRETRLWRLKTSKRTRCAAPAARTANGSPSTW